MKKDKSPEKSSISEITEQKKEEEAKSSKHISKLTVIAASLGLVLLVTALTLIIFRSLNQPLQQEIEESYISEEESLINSAFDDIGDDLASLDEENDLGDFLDDALAITDSEEELEIAVEDMDSLMDELDTIDETLADFSDDDFSL